MRESLRKSCDQEVAAVQKKYKIVDEIFRRFYVHMGCECVDVKVTEDYISGSFGDLKRYMVDVHFWKNQHVYRVEITDTLLKEGSKSCISFGYDSYQGTYNECRLDLHLKAKAIKKYMLDVTAYILNEMDDTNDENQSSEDGDEGEFIQEIM